MTVLVSVKINDGVVMAADSASSFGTEFPAACDGVSSVGGWASLVCLSLGAHLDKLDPRGATPRALARQHPIDHLEVAGQTTPRRRRLGLARPNRAGLVGHPARSLHGRDRTPRGPPTMANAMPSDPPPTGPLRETQWGTLAR